MELQKKRVSTDCWLAHPNGSAADPPARRAGVLLQIEEHRLPARVHPFAAAVHKNPQLKS
jgi:hypothetical protein